MGLPYAENLGRFGLRIILVPDDAEDLQRQFGLKHLLFRMRQAEVGEHIAAAFFKSDAIFFLISVLLSYMLAGRILHRKVDPNLFRQSAEFLVRGP